MLSARLKKLLSNFNYLESQKLLNEIDLHRRFEDTGSLMSLEEEKMWHELFNLVEEYKKYH
jgi:hypothetical protein